MAKNPPKKSTARTAPTTKGGSGKPKGPGHKDGALAPPPPPPPLDDPAIQADDPIIIKPGGSIIVNLHESFAYQGDDGVPHRQHLLKGAGGPARLKKLTVRKKGVGGVKGALRLRFTLEADDVIRIIHTDSSDDPD